MKAPYWRLTSFFKRCAECGKDILPDGGVHLYIPRRSACLCIECGKASKDNPNVSSKVTGKQYTHDTITNESQF